jgi:hypothetical protein
MTTTTLVANSRRKCLEQSETRGVSHCGLAIHIKKYLKAKEKL